MKNDIGKVVGIVRGKKKTGASFVRVSLMGQYEDWEVESYRCQGEHVKEYYMNGECEDVAVGDEVEILFGSRVYDGQAQVKGIRVIE